MRKIKILHVIKSLGRGGAEKLLPETLRVHDKAQFEFHYIYFLPWKNQLEQELLDSGGIVTCLHARNNLGIIFQFRKIIAYCRAHEIQIIHAHLPWAGIVSRLAGKMSGLAVIYTEHNKQERYHILTRAANLLSMNWQTGVIAVSDNVAESIKNSKRNLRIPLYVVLNGVNTEKFVRERRSNTVREQLQISPASRVVGTVAVFRFQKRLDVWLQIAAMTLNKFPDTRFIIVGDGPLKKELFEEAEKLGLQNRIYFVGLQEDVMPYLEAMDIFMISSIFEGLPIALLEAMSMSLPIVTTDAGGIRQVIRDRVDGLLCDADHPLRLTGLLEMILADPSLAQRLGVAARQRAVDSFSLHKMVLNLESLYSRILT